MKRSMLNEWIKRLEDPNAKQAIGTLNCESGMCCLGVLCDIVDPNGWTDGYHKTFTYKDSSAANYIPIKLAEDIGIGQMGSSIRTNKSLSTMNDAGSTFQDIAQILRKKPLEYIYSIEEDMQ